MDDCRILWGRYSLAMERRELSETAAEQVAWWPRQTSGWAVTSTPSTGISNGISRQSSIFSPQCLSPLLRASPCCVRCPGALVFGC